jgi:hypothetical protein
LGLSVYPNTSGAASASAESVYFLAEMPVKTVKNTQWASYGKAAAVLGRGGLYE